MYTIAKRVTSVINLRLVEASTKLAYWR